MQLSPGIGGHRVEFCLAHLLLPGFLPFGGFICADSAACLPGHVTICFLPENFTALCCSSLVVAQLARPAGIEAKPECARSTLESEESGACA